MKKNLLLLSLFLFNTAIAMEVYFTIDKESCAQSNEEFYALLENYLDTPEGKCIALRPERNVFAFPSRHTYMLHLAIHLNDLNKIKLLLKEFGKKIIAGLQFECRTLNYAISMGNPEIIEYLRIHGSNVYKTALDRYSTIDSIVSEEKLKHIKADFIC